MLQRSNIDSSGLTGGIPAPTEQSMREILANRFGGVEKS